MRRAIRFCICTRAIAFVTMTFVPVVHAGPPLVCSPFDIGAAKSLPWGGVKSWDNPAGDYDSQRLVDDALSLLSRDVPVIVRMETIRRATLHAAKDPRLADDLRARFRDRAGNGTASDALALFDYGYLLETFKQVAPVYKLTGSPIGTDGYSYVARALELSGANPQMEFAAAMVTSWPRRARHDEHVAKAAAGAARDSLLAANLATHLSERSGGSASSPRQ